MNGRTEGLEKQLVQSRLSSFQLLQAIHAAIAKHPRITAPCE
jgi:hypothetical protein